MVIDYRLAFDLAPVGLALSRQRGFDPDNPPLCADEGANRQRSIATAAADIQDGFPW